MKSTLVLGIIINSLLYLDANPQQLHTLDPTNLKIKNGKTSEGFPGVVSLQTRDGQHICGGALIKPNLVLTASHCFVQHRPSEFFAQIGAKSLDGANLDDRKQGNNAFFPPGYKLSLDNYGQPLDINKDLAVLQLSKNATDEIAKLNTDTTRLESGTKALAVGYGRVSGKTLNPRPRNLNQVEMEVASDKICERTFDMYNKQESICFQAPKNNPGATTCMGDSGSPLLYNEMVIGVVSAGTPGCNKGVAIFTNVAKNAQWLKKLLATK